MKTCDIGTLVRQGYSEDPSLQRLRASSWLIYLMLAVILGSAIGMFIDLIPLTYGVTAMIIGFVAVLITTIIDRSIPPISPLTGKRMALYRNSLPAPDVMVEYIYVDHDSKRFFRQVTLQRDDGPGG